MSSSFSSIPGPAEQEEEEEKEEDEEEASPLFKFKKQQQTNALPIRSNSKKRFRAPKETAAASFPSDYRGVRRRAWGRYVSEIRIPKMKTRIWLGSFDSPEMAARAYDSAAFFLKGESASLNFPDLAGTLPRPQSSTRRDIQIAAAKAAAAASDDATVNRIELDREPVKDARPVSGSNELEEEEASWWFLDDELACLFDDVLPLEEEEEEEGKPPLGCSTATEGGGNYYYYSSSPSSNQMLC